VAKFFGEFSIVSPLSNLLFLPLVSATLFLGILLLLLGGTFALPFLSHITGALIGLVTRLSEGLTAVSPEPVSLLYRFTMPSFWLAVLLWVSLLLLTKKRALSLLCSLLLFTMLFGGGVSFTKHADRNVDRLVAVTAKKNDYLLLNRNDLTLLCEFSDGSYTSLKHAASLTSSLLYDSSPDGLLLTHLHKRHVTSFIRLADSHRLSILFLPEATDKEEAVIVASLTEAATERGVRVLLYPSHDTSVLSFSGWEITLHPIAYLERSVQPLLALEALGNEKIVYLGGSRLEPPNAKESLLSPLSDADRIWLGIHGPIIKQPLALPLNGVIFTSNETVNEGYQTAYTPMGTGEFSYLFFSCTR
jgi:hypothetical protein